MRPDSIEFGWAQTVARRQRTAGASSARRNRSAVPHVAEKTIVDEAFAVFENASDFDTTSASVDRSLISTLSAQLEALDRQREQLATLLSSISSASTPA